MVSIAFVVFMIIGILLIFVYPKIIRWAIVIFVIYLTIFYDWKWAIIFIPLLLVVWYYKKRGERNG